MEVFTAHYSLGDIDRLDITVKGRDPLGQYFAPTWQMVKQYKKGILSEALYTADYHELMLTSYRSHRDKWEELLTRPRVVLVCFCPSGTFCHRKLLAEYLQKLGAENRGELEVIWHG